MNGIYDWGWLRTDGGIAMPPSDRLEEIGALATLIDENQFPIASTRSANATACPARMRALLREAVEAAGFAPRRKKINAQRVHLAVAGAICRPLRRSRCGRTRSRCLRSSIPSWIRKRPATPIGWTST